MSKKRRDYAAHSARVTTSKRWKAVRLHALERDGWRCVECGERRGLEVDHIVPVKDAPERGFDLANLQCLCGRCHSRKTRLEVGLRPVPPARQAWRNLVRETGRNQSSNGERYA